MKQERAKQEITFIYQKMQEKRFHGEIMIEDL